MGECAAGCKDVPWSFESEGDAVSTVSFNDSEPFLSFFFVSERTAEKSFLPGNYSGARRESESAC